MKASYVVIPKPGVELHCGFQMYSHAVVATVDPFVLVSSNGDMRWNNHSPDDFEVVGVATAEQLEAVNNRIQRDQCHTVGAVLLAYHDDGLDKAKTIIALKHYTPAVIIEYMLEQQYEPLVQLQIITNLFD